MLRHASESPYLRTLQRLASIYHLAVSDSSVITPEDEPWLGYGIYGLAWGYMPTPTRWAPQPPHKTAARAGHVREKREQPNS